MSELPGNGTGSAVGAAKPVNLNNRTASSAGEANNDRF